MAVAHGALIQFLFCYNSDMRRVADPTFELEVEAAREDGFVCHLFGFEDFIDGREERAFEFLPFAKVAGQRILYRGFILKESEYRRLDQALRERGYELYTPPDAYVEALYLPNYYSKIREMTPAAVWMEGRDIGKAWRAARSLGEGPWIVKDHVKSAKHRWETACFIPKDVSREKFAEICRNLLAYQGTRFERGFVFKKFVPLNPLGENHLSYPAFEEYRLIYFEGRLIYGGPYDRVGGERTNFGEFQKFADRFMSRFLTLDVARTAAGEWVIIEGGDASVAGLPPGLGRREFYEGLKRVMERLKS